MFRTFSLWLGSLLLVALTGCVSLTGKKDAEPPVIANDTPLAEALDASITFGDKTLLATKKLIKQRKEQAKAEDTLFSLLMSHYKDWDGPKLINAMNLYQTTTGKRAPELFKTLIGASTSFHHQLAWHLAASVPSGAMAEEVEKKLSNSISENELSDLFLPKMAEAVANNRLTQCYTVVRQGLFETNHVAFARSMISLNPRRASYDFMDYLAQAPVEELRQLSLTSVNVFTCMEILQHYVSYPVVSSHPNFEHLFFYAISRNTALAEMARKVLETYLPHRNVQLALVLARLPSWVQVAFVEGARRQMNPQVNVFLSELKKATNQQEVVEEIDEIVR